MMDSEDKLITKLKSYFDQPYWLNIKVFGAIIINIICFALVIFTGKRKATFYSFTVNILTGINLPILFYHAFKKYTEKYFLFIIEKINTETNLKEKDIDFLKNYERRYQYEQLGCAMTIGFCMILLVFEFYKKTLFLIKSNIAPYSLEALWHFGSLLGGLIVVIGLTSIIDLKAIYQKPANIILERYEDE